MKEPMFELIRPERDRQDLKLFDRRLEDEHVAQERRGEFADRYTMGAPELPEAQIVANMAKGTFGVAVRVARFVCELPKGYERQGLELALIDRGLYVVTFPGKSPLLVNPHDGTVKRM